MRHETQNDRPAGEGYETETAQVGEEGRTEEMTIFEYIKKADKRQIAILLTAIELKAKEGTEKALLGKDYKPEGRATAEKWLIGAYEGWLDGEAPIDIALPMYQGGGEDG